MSHEKPETSAIIFLLGSSHKIFKFKCLNNFIIKRFSNLATKPNNFHKTDDTDTDAQTQNTSNTRKETDPSLPLLTVE